MYVSDSIMVMFFFFRENYSETSDLELGCWSCVPIFTRQKYFFKLFPSKVRICV